MVLGRVVGMIPLHSLKQKTLKHITATPNPPQSIRPECLRYYFKHVNRIPMDPTWKSCTFQLVTSYTQHQFFQIHSIVSPKVQPDHFEEAKLDKKKMKKGHQKWDKIPTWNGGWLKIWNEEFWGSKTLLIEWGNTSSLAPSRSPNINRVGLQSEPLLVIRTYTYDPHKWPYKWISGVITPTSGVIILCII